MRKELTLCLVEMRLKKNCSGLSCPLKWSIQKKLVGFLQGGDGHHYCWKLYNGDAHWNLMSHIRLKWGFLIRKAVMGEAAAAKGKLLFQNEVPPE